MPGERQFNAVTGVNLMNLGTARSARTAVSGPYGVYAELRFIATLPPADRLGWHDPSPETLRCLLSLIRKLAALRDVVGMRHLLTLLGWPEPQELSGPSAKLLLQLAGGLFSEQSYDDGVKLCHLLRQHPATANEAALLLAWSGHGAALGPDAARPGSRALQLIHAQFLAAAGHTGAAEALLADGVAEAHLALAAYHKQPLDRLACLDAYLQQQSLPSLSIRRRGQFTGIADLDFIPRYRHGAGIPVCIVAAPQGDSTVTAAMIRSIQAQTHTNWRLLIASHGALDPGTQAAVAAAQSDPRIIVHNLPELSRSQALAALLREAREDFVLLTGGEAVYFETFLQSLCNRLDLERNEIAAHGMQILCEDEHLTFRANPLYGFRAPSETALLMRHGISELEALPENGDAITPDMITRIRVRQGGNGLGETRAALALTLRQDAPPIYGSGHLPKRLGPEGPRTPVDVRGTCRIVHAINLAEDSILSFAALNQISIERRLGFSSNLLPGTQSGLSWQGRRMQAICPGISPGAVVEEHDLALIYGAPMLREVLAHSASRPLARRQFVLARDGADREEIRRLLSEGHAALEVAQVKHVPFAPDVGAEIWDVPLAETIFDADNEAFRKQNRLRAIGISFFRRSFTQADAERLGELVARLSVPVVLLVEEDDAAQAAGLPVTLQVINRKRNFWNDFFAFVSFLLCDEEDLMNLRVTGPFGQAAMRRCPTIVLASSGEIPKPLTCFREESALVAWIEQLATNPAAFGKARMEALQHFRSAAGEEAYSERLLHLLRTVPPEVEAL